MNRTTPPPDWPNRDTSRTLRSGGIVWHVQVMGTGPVLLLLHGTGAGTHSWRGLMPALAHRFTVVAPDLPGHAFTEEPARARMSIPGMAKLVRGLLDTLQLRPVIAAGHSAGAAIAIRLARDGLPLRGIIGLNAALLPMGGAAGQMFAPLAKLLAGLPFLPALFAARARDPKVVQRLLDGTGSRLDPAGAALYATLLRDRRHAGAALEMMAQWDLAALRPELPRLGIPLLLVTGDADRTVPPAQSDSVAAAVPGAERARLPGRGHLAHEEAPAETAALVTAFAERIGLFA